MNRSKHDLSEAALSTWTKEALIDKVQQLERHVKQLQNVISKGKEEERNKKKVTRPFDFTKYNTRHVALKILYLGWDYQGFAVQEDTDKTIEHAIFEALLMTKMIESRETSNYHRCGRTDKGVSAFSQVISIDLRTNLLEGLGVKVRDGGTAPDRPGDKTKEIDYVQILNRVLPKEMRVVAWCPVDVEFSARFSCTRRTYKYYFPKGDLKLDLMRHGAAKLIGDHDFRNLCKMDVGNGVVKYIRRILSVTLNCLDNSPAGYQLCELTIEGNAFLWHQIRCIVAILFLIGQEKEKPEVIDDLLDVDRNPRKPQYSMASELPLVLFDCEYEDVNWIRDEDCMKSVITHMQQLWTQQSVRTTVIKRMLENLEKTPVGKSVDGCESCVSIQRQAECLIPGHKPKVHRPLLERQTCDSLEERIHHFAKRRKLQGKQETDEGGVDTTVCSETVTSQSTDLDNCQMLTGEKTS